MSIEGMEPQEGEYLAKEPGDSAAMSVTHITNNVVVQNMSVQWQPEPVATAMTDPAEQSGVLALEDELSQLAGQDLDSLLN